MKTYNQNLIEDGHNADCTNYTFMQIILIQYWLKFPYGFIEKTIDNSIIAGILSFFGAEFDSMYNWYIKRVKKKYGITLNLEIDWIKNKIFYKKQFYKAYGLYLINGNKEYLKALKKGKITKLDIDRIAAQGGGFKHNNCYHDQTIRDVYTGGEASCDIDVLRYGVTKGVFGAKARTVEFKKDTFHKAVYKYLYEIRKKPDSSYFTSKLTVLKGEELRGFKTAMRLKYLLK